MNADQAQPIQTIRIRPRRAFEAVNLAELWEYRELLYFLTLRDIQIRYKQTAIGIAWVLLQPIITTAIFTLIFASWARFDTGSVPYPLFALAGLVIWLFAHGSISIASNSFVSNVNLVTKVYFPRLIVPLAATFAGLFDLLFSVAILVILMVYYGRVPTSSVLLAPLFVFFALIQTAAVGIFFSALNVRYRDVKFAVPFMLQVWMIASPIFYPASIVSEKWRLVFAINPLTGIIDGFRSSLFGLSFDWPLIGVSCIAILVSCVVALLVFTRMEDDFADLV